MRPGTARRIAWSCWTLIILLLGTLLVLGGLFSPRADWLFSTVASLSVTGYATVGALIASRHARNAIGWLFLYFGFCFVMAGVSDGYAARAAREGLPGLGAAAMVNQLVLPLGFGALPLILLLFPNGSLPSPRWRRVAWGMVGFAFVGLVGVLIRPGTVGSDFRAPNPLGVEGLRSVGTVFMTVGAIGSVLFAFLCIAGLFLRYRKAGGEERQQIRWLAYVGTTAAVLLALVFTLGWISPVLDEVLFFVFFAVIALGIPAASAIAILRYRLYELDIVVKKTVVFGILAAFITGAYLLVVIGLPTLLFGAGPGGFQSTVPVVAAAVLALLFQPVRNAARRLANRLVYGKRASPYELLAEFAGRAGGTYSMDEVLPRMARAAAEGTGAARVTVWLRVGQALRPGAWWPGEGSGPEGDVRLAEGEIPDLVGEDRTFPVRHQGELLGALSVRASAADPLTPAKEKLLEDLAGQGALIMRNVRLTEELRANLEELRASRQRIVAAQDEERRRLERNIHDGAQQQLVALAVNLRLARTLAAKDPARALEVLERLQSEAQEAMENLRDLARGIFPPLLADKGLAAALEAQARKAAVPVNVDSDGIGRYPQEIEAGVYFCVLEALQNSSKYAAATWAAVSLAEQDGELVFEVVDDGKGFDPAMTPRGSGLQNMEDRVEALGGTLEIVSTPGEGTTVAGRIPVAQGGGS